MTDTQTAEIAALTALLAEDWSAWADTGAEDDGWKTIATIDGEDRRWLRTITVITRAPSGQHYRWEYEHGLTESQESYGPGEYYDLVVKPVWPVDKTEVVREWVTEEPTPPATPPSLPMKRGARFRDPLGAEVTLIEPERAAFAPGLWAVLVHDVGSDVATEAGLIACGYAPITEEGQADA